MLNIQERVPTTIQNPNPDEKILFNDATDGKLKTKDSSGVIEELSTNLVGVPTGGATGEVLAKASATDGDVEWVDPTGGVKEYVALLTQSGTDAPTATVLKNTLGQVPTFVYTSPGIYSLLVQDDIFVEDKTFYQCVKNDRNIDIWIDISPASVGEFVIRTGDPTAANDYLTNTPIKIEVYP